MTDEQEVDTTILQTLMDVVPDSPRMADLITVLANNGFDLPIIAMLKGYGTLLNIIQAASEYEDGTMTARLISAYYELTNTDPGANG